MPPIVHLNVKLARSTSTLSELVSANVWGKPAVQGALLE